jgi:hypothetical protein
MPGSGKAPQVASVYDLDDNGKPVPGSKQSARKERPKITQRDSRSGKSRRSRGDSGVVPKYDEGISPGTKSVEILTEKEVKLERRKSSASSNKSPKKPPSAHENRGFPKLSIPKKDEPSHFGIPTPTSRAPPVAQPLPIRPRPMTMQTYPNRPLSYHAAYTSNGYTGPPLSGSAFFQQQYIPPSYPPQSPSYMRYVNPQVQADYNFPVTTTPISVTPIGTRPLNERFASVQQQTYDPIQRTASAFGVRDTMLDSAYDDGYTSASDGPVRRRASIRVPSARSKRDVDYDAMPPPPRPTSILRRPTTEYYADAPTPSSYRGEGSVYRDDPPSTRRPSLRRNSVSYDIPDPYLATRVFETANAGRRRTSYYGPSTESTGSSDYNSKVRDAQNYQEGVAGPTVPLTADMLKRQQRHAGSSRSTKSSGSRDESDYRKSATTRTTRSGSGGDDGDVTIKVTGQARVTVGSAQIHCTDGGEIEIKQQKAIRNGSERGSEYGGTQRDRDDRRSRVDRPPGRSRMSSSSKASYTRTTPQWI